MYGIRHTYFNRLCMSQYGFYFSHRFFQSVFGLESYVCVRCVSANLEKGRVLTDCKVPFNFFDLNRLIKSVMTSIDFFDFIATSCRIIRWRSRVKNITDLDLMIVLSFFFEILRVFLFTCRCRKLKAVFHYKLNFKW